MMIKSLQKQISENKTLIRNIFGLLIVLIGLYSISLYDYVLFHTIAEVFVIVIMLAIFIIVWNVRRLLDKDFFLFLGISSFFIGILTILHMLTYKGMGIFPLMNSNPATQLWIAAQFMQSVSLLISLIFLKKRLNIKKTIAIYTIITAAIILSIFAWGNFPAMYIEGSGLTPLKIISEYLICLIFFGFEFYLYKNKELIDDYVFKRLMISIIFMIIAELCFTTYLSVYGFANMLGHVFRLFSYYFLYKALIETSLKKPFNTLFRDLKKSERKQHAQSEELQTIIDSSPGIIFYKDKNNRFIRVNNSFAELVGMPKTKIEGKTAFEIFPNDADRYFKDDKDVMNSGKAKNDILEPLETKSGTKQILIDKVPYRDELGNTIGIMGFGIDLTETKKAADKIVHLASFPEFNPNPVIELDINGKILFSNKATQKLLNQMGLNKQITLFIPKDIDAIVKTFSKKAQTSLIIREVVIEKRVFSESIIMIKNLKVIRIYAVEITEIKKSEEALKKSLAEKELLLKEVHHRVKNNLQVISSLLNLQSKYLVGEDSKKIFQENKERIKSIALVHEKLYKSKDLKKANFADYIKELSEDLFKSYGIETSRIGIKTKIDDIHLDIQTAIPCGLIVQELISNSLKYAFPNQRKGEIKVIFTQKNENFKLTISDNGVGIPCDFDINKTNSLGLHLVNMLVDQIGGKIELKRDGGTEFIIIFKKND